ncbi:MAG: glycosyltransferase family 2 protein, partial [Gammaproteobacteria bacterium]|nr:glycosyltransferase family 2 protein [Gammaproteobacteria bacterium]
SLVIPTRDAMEITRTCIQSILERTSYPNYEILLVDNQSRRSDTLTWFRILERNPRVRIIRYDEAFNYSAINNYAVSKAQGEIIALVNNDTEVINRDWLTNMVRHAVRPNIGCVGAKLYFFDNTVQHAGVVLGIWGLAGHSHKHYHRSEPGHQQRLKTTQNLSAVTAACLVVRREIFEKVGGLEEDLRVAFNDVDFCLKVQSEGYRNLFTPDAELYHYESKTRGKEDTPEKKARELREIRYMRQKWAGVIAADPCYNPNLTRMREDFSLDIDEMIP